MAVWRQSPMPYYLDGSKADKTGEPLSRNAHLKDKMQEFPEASAIRGGLKMKKIALMSLVLAAFVVSTAFAYAGSGPYLPYGTERSWKMTHDVSKMLGTYVTDRDGQKIAMVKDFVLDEKGGIAFAILGYSENKGMENLIAVPYDILFYNELSKTFITNLTKEHLASAPKIHDTADLGGVKYAAEVYRFFGIQPSWGSNEGSDEMGD